MERRLFTSESVTEGHPDKICDQISDAVLDAILAQDPQGRVACETSTTTGLVVLMGEITTSARIDYQQIVRDTVRDIGYTRGKFGFDCDTCAVLTAIHEQSPDIAQGVDRALEAREGSEEELLNTGAGDQGLMFGYACRETEELMPYPIALAHALCRRLAEVRKERILPYLRPDGKSQVTVEYDESGKPVRIDTVVLSTQHDPDVTQMQIHGSYAAPVLKKLGFSRAVLAREMDENEIAAFAKCGLETEVFIHGAICVCRSGACLMSSMIGKRSGNRGECAYPCRMEYNGAYPLSLKDMCLARQIPRLPVK